MLSRELMDDLREPHFDEQNRDTETGRQQKKSPVWTNPKTGA
jgi:hypothetical protein